MVWLLARINNDGANCGWEFLQTKMFRKTDGGRGLWQTVAAEVEFLCEFPFFL
jgi:hypothetical protein